ncbi:MAG: metal ABC transporter ATP-binding protein [Limnoraphis robusta]|uniref:Manganese ABC transporter ATP-binding protein n=1 Tax=Limnoraphis robusta CS-951 TaxID=1637645 RepID=A0A0F5Y8G5_9CYAN|nr:metal ABC transporter ATP-binding protein [Limnoraphis robusta]KKD34510.1 manganese ABC transporter ATP-binding protein [Limnoraphis robusta CS-951]MEA5496847.1 metal ABC transporter ATP-binding protein [Limnoraphis robusta BA-68 BA1]MEA5541305.1 metal ABC transporter ATP-binding protein [Limnoraphis robusta Tam1]
MDTLRFFDDSATSAQLTSVSMGISAISINHLSVQYRGVEALQDISLEIKPGRLTGVIGPNGAGKSTLMKAMLGLIPAMGEPVLYGSQPLSQQRQRVAYVPQRSQIDWTYPATVWDVVMMGRIRKTGWFRRFSTVSRRQASEALERVGMTEYKNRPIGQLSGGQQQRVFLARSLAQEAEIFCFDEPFVGIDQKTENIIFKIFRDLANSGKIVLVINHDLGESITNFDEIILLNKELIAAGRRQQVLQEENLSRAYGGKVIFFSENAA